MPISDDEFDELPRGTALEQDIVLFLGKERQAYTAEEISAAGVGQIIVHSNIPRPDWAPETIPVQISLEQLTATLEAMVKKPRGLLEAKDKGDVRYYRLRRDHQGKGIPGTRKR